MPDKLPKVPTADRLLEIFDNDLDLLDFYREWRSNGKNAKQAYLKYHEEVTPESAEVLGCRMLRKVKVADIMREYGLTEDAYFMQLDAGMNATKYLVFGDATYPDHKTRLLYHDKVGKLLGIESEQKPNQTNVQVNFGDFVKNV